ncbi:MAG: dethiobiotin synthase [Deltaproteobacteria bacterium]|nr:dethiobiotin synthase [Deltaproteobacteria bacterium]
MKNKSLFITGTNTGVGKTVVCGCLARFFKLQGINVGIQKWVSTGNKNTSEDIDYCLKMLGGKREAIDPTLISPYTFDFPASPHLAAELEEKKISIDKIKKSYHTLQQRHDLLLVEGVGGVMVPLARDYLLIDLVAALSLPVLIVTHSGLGTINHTLLTIEALRKRDIKILGMVFNFAGEGDKIIEDDNIKIISHLGGIRSFGALPKVDSNEKLVEKFEPIGASILQAIS